MMRERRETEGAQYYDAMIDAMWRMHRAWKPPFVRIISGWPGCPHYECVGERGGAMFIGAGLMNRLLADAAPVGPLSTVDHLMGIEVEPWGSRADHQALADRFAKSMRPGIIGHVPTLPEWSR